MLDFRQVGDFKDRFLLCLPFPGLSMVGANETASAAVPGLQCGDEGRQKDHQYLGQNEQLGCEEEKESGGRGLKVF